VSDPMATANPARVWVGRLLATAVGVGLVLIPEWALRWIPALNPPALTTTLTADSSSGRRLRQLNPAFPHRFFSGTIGGYDLGGVRLTPHRFVDPPAGGLRVVVVGASTVQGYPHPTRLAAPAFLQSLLRATLRRPVDVLNIGITSLASFPVARVVAEAIPDLRPDLIVVYTGHNEFYGVYGVAALRQGGPWPWTRHLHLALMQSRLAGLLGRLITRMRPTDDPDATLLAAMGTAGRVPPGGPARARARHQLRASLEEIVALCHLHEVALVLCAPVGNDAGFAPDSSTVHLPEAQRQSWQRLRPRILPLFDGTPAAADEALRLLQPEITRDNAEASFLRAQALVIAGYSGAALAQFTAARDADPMPWRAPSDLVEVVRDVAAEHHVPLAAVDERFAGASPDALVGWNLLVDHVHPSVTGQILLARAVLDALVDQPAPWSVPSGWEGFAPDNGQLRAAHGDLAVENLVLTRSLATLLGGPPLHQPERSAWLEENAQEQWDQLTPEEQAGVQAWERLGRRPPLVLPTADRLFEAREFAAAAQHYGAAQREAPYTEWGDLWPAVRRGRSLLYLHPEGLTTTERQEIEAAAQRGRLVLGAPGADPAFARTFGDYVRRLKTQSPLP
jgi:lysophospholipase L1-like esterase